MFDFRPKAERLPTFVRAEDGKFYQDLVYQDTPLRRAWFICFDDREPAEIVVRASFQNQMKPLDILKARGFSKCLSGILPGRRTPHPRFFGCEFDPTSPRGERPIDGHDAVSWFIIFRKGVPLPTPKGHDSCVEWYSFFPNLPGAYFGDKR